MISGSPCCYAVPSAARFALAEKKDAPIIKMSCMCDGHYLDTDWPIFDAVTLKIEVIRLFPARAERGGWAGLAPILLWVHTH